MRYEVLEHLGKRLNDEYEPVVDVWNCLEEELVVVERIYKSFLFAVVQLA